MKKMIALGLIFCAAAVFLLAEYRQKQSQEGTHCGMGHKHGERFEIDFYSYASKIRGWNAAFKVSLAVLLIILCIGLNNPYVSAAVIIAMAYLIVVRGGLSLHKYFSILVIPLAFILLATITIAVDFAWKPIGQYNLHLGFFYIFTSQGKIKAMFFIILKAFAAVSALQMMTLSTPSSEIITVLRKAHIPKIIIELMNMTYRCIFILLDIHSKMKNSADSREGFCDFKTSLHTFGGIASNMFVISMKKANGYYDAMEARCYDGEMIFLEEEKEIKMIRVISAAVFIAILFLIWKFTE